VVTTSAAARPGTPARAQATTFTVATTIDAPHAAPLDGTCTSTLSGGACTLRAAIQAADFAGEGPHARPDDPPEHDRGQPAAGRVCGSDRLGRIEPRVSRQHLRVHSAARARGSVAVRVSGSPQGPPL
jgi:xanthine/CO dehydrogenase XdhC/CoxF family maturation factor